MQKLLCTRLDVLRINQISNASLLSPRIPSSMRTEAAKVIDFAIERLDLLW